MKCTTVSVDSTGLKVQAIPEASLPELLHTHRVLWVDFCTEDRKAVQQVLTPLNIRTDILDALQQPGQHVRLRGAADQGIVDLNLFPDPREARSHFITMLFLKDLVITVTPEGTNYLEQANREWQSIGQSTELTSRFLAFGFFNSVIDNDTRHGQDLNAQTAQYSQLVLQKGGANHSYSGEVLRLKQRTILYQEVLENQYAAFGLLPVHLIAEEKGNVERLERLVKAIEHLQRMAERIEDKLDDVHEKYLYDIQDQTNRRINLLTVIQSIFVPITFVAGLYGMNFTNMPELQWQSGYYYAIGLMISIIAIELYIFYRSGWFK